jgi:hypothetical protein
VKTDANADRIFFFSGEAIPDPIKMVRRLTALEIALGSLKRDCEIISTKRNGMVKSVLENQQRNASRVQQVCV